MKRMFDIDGAAKRAGLSQKELEEIEKEVRAEFPNDEMMYELHVIRRISYEGTKDYSVEERIPKIKAEAEACLEESGYELVAGRRGTYEIRRARRVKST